MNSQVHSWEIVLHALYLEGGASRAVHTEDIAAKCFALAAGAFSWVKRPDYPDKEIVRRHLIRLRVGEHGGKFVMGRAGRTQSADGETTSDGWQLTPEGVTWILANHGRLEEQVGGRAPRGDRQEVQRALKRVREHSLFYEYLDNPEAFVPQIGDLAELLRCRVDADEQVWGKRFGTLRNQAELAEQRDLLAFIDKCEVIRPHLK